MKFIKNTVFFVSLYIFWFFFTSLFTSKEQLQQDLPTASALAFFAITGAFLLFLAYHFFRLLMTLKKKLLN